MNANQYEANLNVPSEPTGPSDGNTVGFDEVLRSEINCVNARRHFLNWKYPSHRSPQLPDDTATRRNLSPIDAVGLALSGGGIRSAAFCLGVLQALDSVSRKVPSKPNKQRVPTLLERVDYLSTVSGGGYVGSSLTAALSMRAGRFPFRSKLDQEETRSIKHIRDHSNYLFPNGLLDGLDSIAIYLRGLLANFVIVLAPLLALVAFTVFCSPTQTQLAQPKFYRSLATAIFGVPTPSLIAFDSFAFTKLVFITSMLLFLLWGLISIFDRLAKFSMWTNLSHNVRQIRLRVRRAFEWIVQRVKRQAPEHGPTFWEALTDKVAAGNERKRPLETGSRWARVGGLLLAILLFCAFCEAQPKVL